MNKYSLTLIRKALFKRDPPISGEFQFSEDDKDVVNKKVIVDFRLLATLKSFKTSHNFDAHPTVDELDKVHQQLNEMSLCPIYSYTKISQTKNSSLSLVTNKYLTSN